MADSDPQPEFRLDRTALFFVPFDEQDNEGEYWQTKTPEERMRALEYMRRMAYGEAALQRMDKTAFSIVQRDDADDTP